MMNAFITEKYLFFISLRSGTLITLWLILLTHLIHLSIDAAGLRISGSGDVMRIIFSTFQFCVVELIPFCCLFYFPDAKKNYAASSKYVKCVKYSVWYCGGLTILIAVLICKSIISTPASQFNNNAIYFAAVPNVIVLGLVIHFAAVVYSYYLSLLTTPDGTIRCVSPRSNPSKNKNRREPVVMFADFANLSSAPPTSAASTASGAAASVAPKIRSLENNGELNSRFLIDIA